MSGHKHMIKIRRLYWFFSVLAILTITWINCAKRVSPPATEIQDSHYARGLEHFARENYDAAEIEFHQAIKETPDKPDIYVKLGQINVHKRALESAQANFNQALKINANLVDAIVGKATIALQKDKLTEALNLLHQAIEIDENHVEAHYILGLAYQASDNIPYAIEQWQMVLAWDPGHIAAQNQLKLVYATESKLSKKVEYEKLIKAAAIKRCEMAWILSREFNLPQPQQQSISELPDIKSHWARKEILQAVAARVIMPFQNEFKPESPLSRRDLALVAQNLHTWHAKDPAMATTFKGMASPYNDVTEKDPAFNAIMLVTTLGVMEGYYDGTFQPNANPTGQEVFQVIEKVKDNLR